MWSCATWKVKCIQCIRQQWHRYTPNNEIRLSWSEVQATWPLVTDLSVFSVYASNGRHHRDKLHSNCPD